MEDVEELEPEVSPDGEEVSESTGTPDEPDYKTLYEEAKESSQAELQNLRNIQAANEARMAQLENLMSSIARGGGNIPKDEEIDPEDPAAVYKLAERMVDQKVKERDRVHEQRYQQMAERQVLAERKEFEAREPQIAKRFKNDIEQYYRQYPHERTRPGSFGELITYLKGQHFEELARDYAKKPKPPTAMSPLSPSGPSPRPVDKKPVIDPEAERIANIYRRMSGKAPITAEEWEDVRTNYDKYPGRRPSSARRK